MARRVLSLYLHRSTMAFSKMRTNAEEPKGRMKIQSSETNIERSNEAHWDVTKLRKNTNRKARIRTCFTCHEITDIIVVSQVITEYYVCGMCGRKVKTW